MRFDGSGGGRGLTALPEPGPPAYREYVERRRVNVAFLLLLIVSLVLALFGSALELTVPTSYGRVAVPLVVIFVPLALLSAVILSIRYTWYDVGWDAGGTGEHYHYPVRYVIPGSRDPEVLDAQDRLRRGEIPREEYDARIAELERRGRGPGGPYA
jgi:hypothetical protein